MAAPDLETIELLPAAVSPGLLFVLLHDADGTALDMLALGNWLGDAFAQAAVLIPEGLTGPSSERNDAQALAARVRELAAFVQAQQRRLGVLKSDTALAGFGAGATLALALSDAHDGLVGRVLAFGGAYAQWPTQAPQLTTLHLLHGARDRVEPLAKVRQGFERLLQLKGDATLDVASTLGHEMHPALMAQAVMRLQTCVPLRFWKAL